MSDLHCVCARSSRFFTWWNLGVVKLLQVLFEVYLLETIPEAWERFQDYISDCPHHGMARWLLMQTFYHGLTQKARECLDVSAKGLFLELTIGKAEILLDKVAKTKAGSKIKLNIVIKLKKYQKK